MGALLLSLLYQTTAFAADSDFEAGGLAPPPAIESDPYAQPANLTDQQLDEAERADSGRGLKFVWLDAEVGGQHLGLQTFQAKELVDAEFAHTSQTGLMVGAGLGLRLVVFTLGARFRLGNFSEWKLWTLNGELGIRVPIGIVEPNFFLSSGLASIPELLPDGTGVEGFNARLGGGVDVFVSDYVTLGANLSGDVLFLSRSGTDATSAVTAAQTPPGSVEEIYEHDGSSIGGALTVAGVVGLHF